jgi:signal recognition particle receptor subunit alpha
VDLYGDQLKKPHTSIVECPFGEYFDQQLRELEGSAPKVERIAASTPAPKSTSTSEQFNDEPPPLPGLLSRGPSKNNYRDVASNDSTPLGSPDGSRPATPSGHLLTAKGGPGGKVSRRARKVANSPGYASSGGEESAKKKNGAKAGTVKKGRRWDADGMADEEDDSILDYSASANGPTSDGEADGAMRPGTMEAVDQTSWGSKTGKGQFVLKDLDNEVHSILSSADAKKAESSTASSGMFGSGINAIGGLFRNVVGGKVLTKQDLDKAMKGMEDHLLKKNVAREAAIRLCEGVERELIGVKTGSFESKSNLDVWTS